MNRTAGMLALTLAVGITLSAPGERGPNAQQEARKATVLLRTDLAGMEGKEGVVILFELAPGAMSAKTYHPGHELTYVLEGAGILEVEGEPKMLKAGEAFYLPPKRVHYTKNEGAAALKAIVVFIHERGQPISVPVK